jgi:hypothetical protein
VSSRLHRPDRMPLRVLASHSNSNVATFSALTDMETLLTSSSHGLTQTEGLSAIRLVRFLDDEPECLTHSNGC